MDLQQLAKRVEWLDDERRKDKNTIVHLDEKIDALERKLANSDQENTLLTGEITRLKTVVARMDQFDGTIAQHRTEFNRQFKEQEKLSEQRGADIITLLRTEIRSFEKIVFELRKDVESYRGLKKDMQNRVIEENRLSQLLNELGKNLDDLRINEEEQSRIYRLLEDGRRQDTRRLTDVQGEVVAIRKRSDENRGRVDIADSTLRKLETRVNELVNAEQERRDTQAAYLERQALAEVDRDTAWKDWQSRFSMIEKQSVDVESQLQNLDATYLTVKRTQDAVEDLMQRVDRRINEVAEIQRLAEERFRQEWTTFKADDQKRWTNYTLSQDEQRGEVGRRFDRITDRVTYIEDNFQEIQDILQHVNNLNGKNLHVVLTALHEWVTEYDRSIGSAG